MEKLTELLLKVKKYREKRDDLKLWLSQKEVVEYYKWRAENDGRTARDKIISQLKMENENWLVREKEYVVVENKYAYYKNILEVVEGMLNNPSFEKIDIITFLNEILEGDNDESN